jgi:phage head maturation protease
VREKGDTLTVAKARMFGQITKVEEQDDGTIIVSGVASTPTKDSDGESFTGDCLRGAIPEYMQKRRALREMHQPIAAGVTTQMYVDDDDVTHITAHVVDPVSVLKVQTGVLKMFSIQGIVPPGGRDSNDRKVIHKLNLREVSLVDVGANPDAMIETVKLDGATDEEEALVADEVKEPVVAEPVTTDSVKKGLYGVSRFAELLQSIGYTTQDAQYESEYEGDNSPIPAQLRTWLASGAELLKAMTEEETAELLASLKVPDPVEVVALAEKPAADADNVEKKGATISAATRAKLDALKGAIEKAQECMKAFDTEEKDDDASAAEKVETPAVDADTVAKVAGLEDSVLKISAERDALKDAVAKLEGEASQHQAALDEIVKSMKAKGYLLVAEKGREDNINKAAGVEAEPSDPLDAMKKTFASGPTIHPRA